MASNFARALPWLLGFFLVANGTVLTRGGASIRATDLLAIVLSVWLVLRSSGRAGSVTALATVTGLALLPTAWIGLSFMGIGDRATLAQGVRWVLAVPWTLTLVGYSGQSDRMIAFIKGIALGCVFNALVVVAQKFGVDGPLQKLGFSSYGTELVWVGQQLRLPGLHGSPSASSAVISLVAPATFWLYLRNHGRILWPAVGLGAAAGALHLTSSRSPLVMILLTSVLALAVAVTRVRALRLWAILLGVGIPLLVLVGPPGGWVRWTDTGDALVNLSNRLGSNLSTLDIALRHPFGMGVEGGQRALFEDTGFQATHNAWLQAAMVFGFPLALAIGVGFFTHIVRLRRGWRSAAFWPALVAFHLTGLFFFEEHLNNPTFVILTMWLVCEAVVQGSARTRIQSVPSS